MPVIIPEWLEEHMVGRWSYFMKDEPIYAGISGGQTSGLMHILVLEARKRYGASHPYTPSFQNTGKEHEKTLVFLANIEKHTEYPIVWLEFTPPAHGESLTNAGYRMVTFHNAARQGEPFEAFLASSYAYATLRGVRYSPPNVHNRSCTGQLKIKVLERYIPEQLYHSHFVGLRYDEPKRVSGLKKYDTEFKSFECPLSDAHITKEMVLRFWNEQPFRLDLAEHHGNCTKCFLKTEVKLSRAMEEMPEDVEWWLTMQERYGDFRQQSVVRPDGSIRYKETTMKEIWRTLRFRFDEVRQAVKEGRFPTIPTNIPSRRVTTIYNQERDLYVRQSIDDEQNFSCQCELAYQV